MARHAHSTVPFYRKIYDANRLASARQIPFVAYDAYIGVPIASRITSYGDICLSRTYLDGAASSHGVKLLDQDDVADEYYLLERLLTACGVKRGRVNVVTGVDQVYAASELARMMCFIAREVIIDAARSTAGREGTLYDGAYTLTQRTERRQLASVRFVSADGARFTCDAHSIVVHPLLGWLGCTAPGSRTLAYPADCYRMEERDGRLVVTSFINRLQPVVRLVTDVLVSKVSSSHPRVDF